MYVLPIITHKYIPIAAGSQCAEAAKILTGFNGKGRLRLNTPPPCRPFSSIDPHKAI